MTKQQRSAIPRPRNRSVARKWRIAGLVAAALATGGISQMAVALPAFGIVAPREWNLPVLPAGQTLPFFFQTGIINNQGNTYDLDGNKTGASAGRTIEGFSRFGSVFSFNLGGVRTGSYWEVLVPEVNIQTPGNGPNRTGIGDPLFATALYWRKDLGEMLGGPAYVDYGIQNIISVPLGSDEVSSHAWADFPFASLYFGAGNFGAQLSLGAQITSHVKPASTTMPGDAALAINGVPYGMYISAGNQYYAQGAVSWQFNNHFTAGIQAMWDKTLSGTLHGPDVDTRLAGSRITDLGPSFKVAFNSTNWISMWYYQSVDGRNTPRDSAFIFRFVHLM